ncbi:autotransporter domain-containing protein [Pandoraea sp. CB10b_02]|uniref:autotransporter domain-containing protein n=1 Tax=Pandoraea sp. CB10b_02 TaxID=2014535 RepID=UPI00257C8081|nr:autotransporter domain-containing protein [Pandoraea sp. CB10b_02]
MNIRGGLPASWRNGVRAVLAVLMFSSASSAVAAVQLDSVSPRSGPSAGQTQVTLTGSGFVPGATTVSFGGAFATNVDVVDASHLTATTPPQAVGPATVTVAVPGDTTSMVAAYTFVGKPTVSAVSPASGPATGGTTVTITGTNFVDVTSVLFDRTPGTNVMVSDGTRLTVTSPPGSGTVDITVTSAGGTSDLNGNDRFTYTAVAPTLTINTTALATGTVGQPYNQPLSISGGTAPYNYAITGLPSGLGISNGAIAGTPTQAGGPYNVTITVTDSSTGPGAPFSTTKSLPLTINPATSNQVPSAPAVQARTAPNTPVTIRATANAVGGPFTRVAISTPPSSGTAIVNGEDIVYTPGATTSGNVSFAYTLTNAFGTSAPIAVTVAVSAVPVPASNLQATIEANGIADIDITGGALGGPFIGANVVSVSPANAGTATIVATPVAPTGNSYRLRFAPAAAFAGTAVLTYTLSNANATSAPATARVTVAARRDPSADPDVTGLIGAQVETARRFATTQIGNYNSRLEALHGTGRAPSSNGLNVVLPNARRGRDASPCDDVAGISARDACLRGNVSPTALAGANGAGLGGLQGLQGLRDASVGASGIGAGDSGAPNLPGPRANEDRRFAFWTAGTVDFGFANTAAQRSGFRFTTGGVTMGADYRFSDQFSLGAGVGYGHDSTDVGSSGTRSTGDSYSGALYASFRPTRALFIDAVAGFGTLSFDSRRWVIDANDYATGKRHGQQFFGSLSAGYEYRSDAWLFSPYGRLTASRSTLDQYSETGAGLNALTYFKQNVNTLSGTLGVRAGFAKATRIGTLAPYLRVELQHDFNGQSLAGLAYADLASSGPVYFVPGSPYGSERVQIGVGAKLSTRALVFGLDYSATTGMGGLQQGVRLMVTAPF